METDSSTGSQAAVFFVSDHLGSTNKLVDPYGAPLTGERQLYMPWGESRSGGLSLTRYQYTGQTWDSSVGLYYYGARWYDAYITQFSQPDAIIPDPYNPLDWNRYGYARYNALKYTDPSGHRTCDSSNLDQCSMGGSLISKEYQPWTKDEFSRWTDYVRNNYSKYVQDFRITFADSSSGIGLRDWNFDQKVAILIAAMLAGSKLLHSHPAYGTSSAAFNSVYSGGVNFQLGNCGHCPANGAYSSLASLIQFDNLLTSDLAFGINNVIHEFGHIFDQIPRPGDIPSNLTYQRFPNARGLDVRISGQDTPQEYFADTFLDWVIGQFTGDSYGAARSSWMDSAIGSWLP